MSDARVLAAAQAINDELEPYLGRPAPADRGRRELCLRLAKAAIKAAGAVQTSREWHQNGV